MRDRTIGGTIFALGLMAISACAVVHYVIAPIICGITAGCGVASW